MDEIWKQIKDYPKYEVSNLGNVRNINTDNDKDVIHFDSLCELADALCIPPSTLNWRLLNNKIVAYNNNFYNIRKYE